MKQIITVIKSISLYVALCVIVYVNKKKLNENILEKLMW